VCEITRSVVLPKRIRNGWISPATGARWGIDYVSRAATAMSNMYVNRPDETTYFYNDNDSQGKQLEGRYIYAITFAKGQLPPVKGFSVSNLA
jgi:hypothetical protein